MATFNEWMTKRVETEQPLDNDEAIIENQLSQLTDKLFGILYNAPEERQGYLLQKFIESLQNRKQ